jgi:hypothetical protein
MITSNGEDVERETTVVSRVEALKFLRLTLRYIVATEFENR